MWQVRSSRASFLLIYSRNTCGYLLTAKTPSVADLLNKVGDYEGLIVRSATKVSAEVFKAGKNLKIVGRAGVGVDNVDVDEATRR
jgi:phosphoglycerate dehydrogenase-like enzyme